MNLERLPTSSDTKVKGLIYGNPGVGKTMFCAVAPKPIIANCEGGLLCLDKISAYHDDLDLLKVDIHTIKDLQELYNYLSKEEHDRETVVIDSLAEVIRIGMDEIISSPNRDARYGDAPTLQDYSLNTNRMRKIVRLFRDLPMHVFFTCHASNQKDEQSGRIMTKPSLTPRISEEVMGYVDLVGYLFVADVEGNKTERRLLTQPKGKFEAKDRSGKLGVGMTNPMAYDVIGAITGCKIPEYVKNIKELVTK